MPLTEKNLAKLSSQEKKQKLLSLMNSVFVDDKYKHELESIMNALSIDYNTLEKEFLAYNMDVHDHDNSVYKESTIRMVLHIHNLIAGSWHIPRQQAVRELVELAQPRKVIDLGFGVPSRYVFDLLKQKNFHLTMCDYQLSATKFAEVLLTIWDSEWRNNINLICEDMENTERCIKDYDLYISLHSIEHVGDPTACMQNYIKATPPNARFLMEIPIGPITPEHNIEWANKAEAQAWFAQLGLTIVHERFTQVNPKVDLFAEAHEYNYGGYLVLCEKRA